MSRFSTVSVLISSWSASVDLPWSMCAMMEKLRTRSGATCGQAAARGWGLRRARCALCCCRDGWGGVADTLAAHRAWSEDASSFRKL